MAKKITGVCRCGFSFVTPHGEDDARAVMQYHVKRVHKKEYLNRVTGAQALEDVGEVM